MDLGLSILRICSHEPAILYEEPTEGLGAPGANPVFLLSRDKPGAMEMPRNLNKSGNLLPAGLFIEKSYVNSGVGNFFLTKARLWAP